MARVVKKRVGMQILVRCVQCLIGKQNKPTMRDDEPSERERESERASERESERACEDIGESSREHIRALRKRKKKKENHNKEKRKKRERHIFLLLKS